MVRQIFYQRAHTVNFKVIQQHNPRQSFQIRHVTLFHLIFIIVTAINRYIHIIIHLTANTTSDIHIYLNTMHEQLTFISSVL